jgi:hypothetical protein
MTSSLFSLVGKLGFGGPSATLAATAVSAGAAERARSALGSLGAGPPKIDWEAYNWPTSLEVAGLTFGIVHFDLEELKTKRDAAVHALARDAYRWWQFTMLLSLLNFVDCIALAATSAAYPGINVLFSLIWALVWAPAGMAVVYHAYKGYAENATVSKIAAKAGAACVAVLIAVMCLGAFGNLNGFASLGGPRLTKEFAAAGGSPGAAQFWTAVVVVESLLWLANGAAFGHVALRIFKGPTVANAPEAVK